MQDTFQITFSDARSEKDIEAIKDALKNVDEVIDTGSMASREVDPSTLLVWVKLVSGFMGAISTAVPLLQKIIEIIRGKGISGANIKLPNGFEISVDKASTKDIERILQAARQK